MKYMWKAVFSILFAAVCVSGCKEEEKELKPGEPYVCYVDLSGSSLVRKAYAADGKTTEEQIDQVLETMQNPEENEDYKSAFPKGIEVESAALDGKNVDLAFGKAYKELKKQEEVLLRAAAVQSLAQLEGVDYVRFIVDGKPLMNVGENGSAYMSADDFVQNIGPALNSYQKTELQLYFAAKDKDGLEKETVRVRYNSNMSVEKLIIDQLLKGPQSGEGIDTLPPETDLLSVSVRDGICYVNFDEGFLKQGYDIAPQLVIDSLVHSLTEGGNATQVQISVNGESDVMFQETVDLSKPIARNLDLLEETEQE